MSVGSVKASSDRVKVNGWSWSMVWSGIRLTREGGSSTLMILSAKSVLAVAPALSIAVTVMTRVPTSVSRGTPAKVRSLRAKPSHEGSGVPSFWTAS